MIEVVLLPILDHTPRLSNRFHIRRKIFSPSSNELVDRSLAERFVENEMTIGAGVARETLVNVDDASYQLVLF